VNLCHEMPRAGVAGELGQHLDSGASDAAATVLRQDRELRNVPAVVARADQAHADDLSVGFDEEGQPLRFLPVRVEVRIRVGTAVELEQVVGEQTLQLLAFLQRRLAEPDFHAATVPARVMMTAVSEPEVHVSTDGVVTLQPPRPGDAQLLVAGRDEEFFKWLGPGSETPSPAACVWVGAELVGWVDYDLEHDWLQPGEVNVGYYLFPTARGKGYASRAVELLLLHLHRHTEHTLATLVIDSQNVRSIELARRLGFAQRGELEKGLYFARAV
jgi:RimJ/RimL family protein N-acetyltransferase